MKSFQWNVFVNQTFFWCHALKWLIQHLTRPCKSQRDEWIIDFCPAYKSNGNIIIVHSVNVHIVLPIYNLISICFVVDLSLLLHIFDSFFLLCYSVSCYKWFKTLMSYALLWNGNANKSEMEQNIYIYIRFSRVRSICAEKRMVNHRLRFYIGSENLYLLIPFVVADIRLPPI